VSFFTEQIAEGTVGSLWRPEDDLADDIQVLEADDITGVSDGDTVQTWQAATGNNATQATASRRATYTEKARQLLPALTFADDGYTVSLANASSNYTFYFVINPTLDATTTLLFEATGAPVFAIIGENAVDDKIRVYDAGAAWQTVATAATGWQVLTIVMDSSAGVTVYRNGTDITEGSPTYTQTAIAGTVYLLADSAPAFYTGSAAAIVIANAAHTDAVREQTEGYLAHKWDLQGELPFAHTYKKRPPVNYA
jgi:hypothetical protein